MKYKIKPWAHQLAAIERARELPHFAFLFEVGTGKTGAAINTIRYKFKSAGRIQKTLILSPPITLENWKREFGLHSEIGSHHVTVLTGAGAHRAKKITEMGTAGHIFVTNPESLLMESVWSALEGWGVEVLVVDEAHRFKNLQAKRTKQAIKLADNSKVRLILTGTPVLNTPMDIFAQWRILDKGETFGTSFYTFRAKYFWDSNAGMPKSKYFPKWIPKASCFAEIRDKIRSYSMTVKKKDCLDLPPLVRKEIVVELGGEQKRLYEEMKRDFIAFLSTEQAAVATLAITKALRLMEICSGFITIEGLNGDERKKRQLTDNPRAAALTELLEDLAPHHKVIVWAVFKDNYGTIRTICEGLGLRFVEIHGGVGQAQKDQAVDSFSNDPDCRVLIGHPRSGGIGINLVASSVSIFYSRTFSLEDDIQAEARNYRGGSEIHESVFRIDIVARGTIDEDIAARLAEKQAVGESVIRDIGRNL